MKTLLLPFLLFSSLALAENHAVILGAGGEPAGSKTIFDRSIPLLKNIEKNGWKTEISFNGGHTKTEKILNKNFGNRNRPFTKESYEKMIKDYSEKIESGVIKPGDQLMLIVVTHGFEHIPLGEKSHHIATSGTEAKDLISGMGSDMVSMDDLEPLIKLAEEKGVKLALLDLSCHSGNTLKLNAPKTCIISAAGPNHFGFIGSMKTFTHKILDNLKNSSDLETAFLNARREVKDKSFPMISSPVGKEINQELYEQLDPFLHYHKAKADKLGNFIMKRDDGSLTCDLNENRNELFKLIDEVSQASNNIQSKEVREFKTAVDKYYKFIEEIQYQYSSIPVPEMDKKETFCPEKPRNPELKCLEYDVATIMNGEFGWVENVLNFTVNSPDAEAKDKSTAQDRLEAIQLVKNRKAQLLQQFPDLKKKVEFFENKRSLEKKTESMVNDVVRAQQKLYDALYLEKSKNNKDPNPCKDFKL